MNTHQRSAHFLHNAKLALALSMAALVLYPAAADASSYAVTPMGGVLCGIINMIFGNFGRGLATLAIISLGVGAMLGKVSWGLAMTVSVGIGVVFGSATITSIMLATALPTGSDTSIGCTFAY